MTRPDRASNDVLELMDPARAHDGAARLFAAVSDELAALLPYAEIHHVGSTALPGAATKGDLDVQLRVERDRFDESASILRTRFAVLDGGFEPPDGMSFKDESTAPELGVHLTVRMSEADLQWVFCEMLREDAALRLAYDELKRRFAGRSMDAYRDEKDAFFSALRASPRFDAIRRKGHAAG